MAIRYKRLRENEIRVLSISTQQEFRGQDQLVCTLEHIKLDADPQPVYHALSYTWQTYDEDGSPIPDDKEYKIRLNGKLATVGQNLWLALWQFRDLSLVSPDSPYFAPFPTGTKLWVDALCINQADTREKDKQILLMRKIYQKAEIVNVWLGPEVGKSAIGMKFVSSLEEQVRAIGARKVDIDWIGPLMQAEMKDPAQEDSWMSLSDLFRRPYWSRVWIVQELVSNLRTYLHVGPRTTHLMPLLSMGNTISLTAGIHSFDTQLPQERSLLSSFDSQAIVNDRYSFMDPDYDGHPLLDLLVNYRHHRCSDPRDKIYGFASLAYKYNGHPIHVDYKSPVQEVFQTAAQYIISGSKRLDILCIAERVECNCQPQRCTSLGLPSWVPNWNCVPKNWERMKFDLQIPWDATSKSESVSSFSVDGKRLTCKGAEIGVVAEVYQLNEVSALQSEASTLQAFSGLLKFLNYDACSSQISFKSLWEIFCSYQTVQDLIANALPLERFEKLCMEVILQASTAHSDVYPYFLLPPLFQVTQSL